MRILIVGAGVAGLTLAGLLHRQGHGLCLVDRQPEGADLGYALSLWPQGSRVLHAVGSYDRFKTESEPMSRYSLRDSRGRLIGSYDIPPAISSCGHIGTIPRPDFITLLQQSLGGMPIRHGVSVEGLCDMDDGVDVQFTDGSQASFDLVIGSDGIHSRVRQLLFGSLPEYDTGWGCYVWWGDPQLTGKGETRESWGVGRFLGLYPCRNRLCIIVGAPVEDLLPSVQEGRADRLKTVLKPFDLPLDDFFVGLPPDTERLFLWRMADVRAPCWVKGRTVLVGDAAAAFLPTAGIGASMALESAAVLADELSRTDDTHLSQALALYVTRRRRRVLTAQNQSRWLARVAFIRSRPLGWIRDQLMRFATFEQMIAPILKQLRTPI